MKTRTQKNITNYFLTICFILLIVVFVISLIAMSKLVLTGIDPIQRHVADTQTLLDDIQEVEKVTTDKLNTTFDASFLDESEYFEFNYKGFGVTDISYRNVNQNKSIVTFFFDKSIGEIEGYYYVIVQNLSSLAQGDQLIYLSPEGTETGKYISHEEDGTIILGKTTSSQLRQVPKEWLLGKVFFIEEND